MKDLSLEQFRWDFADSGYDWETHRLAPENLMQLGQPGPDRRVLLQRQSDAPGYTVYSPLIEFPTLFKTFAELEPSEATFAQFAGSYGLLGGISRLIATSGPMRFGEDFDDWRLAHRQIRSVADVLSALQANELATLEQWFEVRDERAWYEREDALTGKNWKLIASTGLNEWKFEWIRKATSKAETLIRAAQFWSQDQINTALSGDKKTGKSGTSARVLWNQDTGKMFIHIVPATLLGAMWYQCARVLTLNPSFKQCENCGKWFELSPDSRRRNTKYCSDRCKVAAYRVRKASERGIVGAGKNHAWMSVFYRPVREREGWSLLSASQRIDALKTEIRSRPNGSRFDDQLALMDESGAWDRAILELEEMWRQYRNDWWDESLPPVSEAQEI